MTQGATTGAAVPDATAEFLRSFLDAVEQVSAALGPAGDAAARRQAATAMLLRQLVCRFAREAAAAGGMALVAAGNGASTPGEDAARASLAAIEGRFRFRLQGTGSEASPDDDALSPEILAAAHAAARSGRHESGVYYTPAGEVRLMCREALRARLARAAGRPDDDPLLLGLLYGEDAAGGDPKAAGTLYRTLSSLRVCDPAAGCGALLLGMAHEAVRLLAALGRALPAEAQERLLAESYPDPRSPFALRRHIASATLYGLDIDAGAVEVTRWRLLLFTLAVPDAQAPDALLQKAVAEHLQVGDGLAPPPEPAPVQLNLFDSGWGRIGRPAPPKCEENPGLNPWHHRFPEVFQAPSPGFDCIVSNPPYVRQELLSPAYKVGAQHACQALLPTETRLDGKSDLYAYFYHLAIGLLREGGSLCIISSNSWLDVGFGAGLRSLLLRHCRLLAVIESASDATFADARVNPSIVVARREEPGPSHEGPVRFIRLRDGLGIARGPDAMTPLAGARRFLSLPELRVVPVSQATLASEDANWGGHYLRSPDLFHELMDACGSRLCRLDALASVRFGIKTGANAFFYLEPVEEGGEALSGASDTRLCRNGAGHVQALESCFLQPVLCSPRELRTPELLPEALTALLLVCNETRDALAGTWAGRYLALGESEWGIPERPSVRGRPWWYQVPLVAPPPVIHPLIAFERACAAVNPKGVLCDANLVGIYPRHGIAPELLAACMLSSLGVMARELAGIANLGQGALKTNPAYLARMVVPDLREAEPSALARVRDAFEDVRRLPFPSLLDGDPGAPWRALDDAVLELLGAGAPEGVRLRAATREMVAARLAKAGARRPTHPLDHGTS